MDPKDVKDMIEQVGGKIEDGAVLPDGHAFMTASFPLPKDHWIYGNGGFEAPPMTFRMGTSDPRRREWEKKILEAAKYAIKASTMNGKENDFDPDALARNMIVGMLGYYTKDGISHSDDGDWLNPDPIPEFHKD